MDALIQLDPVPIAPLTENSEGPRIIGGNVNMYHQQLVGAANDPVEESDLIDLTLSQGDKIVPSNHDEDMAHIAYRPIPLTLHSPVIVEEEISSMARTRSPTKHKLPPSLSDQNPSKVSRYDYYNPMSANIGPDINHDNIQSHNERHLVDSRPTSSHERTNPFVTSSSVKKTHTVTSANDVAFGSDMYNRLNSSGIQALSNGYPRPISSQERPFIPTSSSVIKTHTVTSANDRSQSGLNVASSSDGSDKLNKNAIIPQLSFVNEEVNNFQNSRSTFTLPRPTNEVIMEEKLSQTKATQQISLPDSNNMFQSIDKEKESVMFYQLLDMFPDIDLKFLQNQCSLGLNINQVTNNILEMDYPKSYFQNSDTSTIGLGLTPKVVVNVNLNNINIPSSSSSSTTQILADEELKSLVVEKKNENVSINIIPATTSIPILRKPNLTCASTSTHTSKNEEIVIESCPKSCNIQKKIKEIQVDEPIELLSSNKLGLNDSSESVQSQFGFLMAIFPDADPTFMEIKSTLKSNDLRNFIAESLEKRDYPKVTVPQKHENGVADDSVEMGLYTTNFNLKNFIKIFPDPFAYFLDEKRSCQNTVHALEFLKRRYRNHAIKLISIKFKEFKYNLTKTCEFLDVEKPSRATKRGLCEIKMPEETNLPFLQEACFIEHKTEIKTYLDGIAESKRLSYEQAEARGELIECGCCYQDVLFEDCANCNEGHLFCKTCVQKSVEVRVGDGLTTFPCLQDCGSVFSLQVLEALVDATMFSRLLQRIQLDEVRAADIDGLEVCPFCDFAIILPPETSIFKCLNPECLKESCRKCHRLSHIPQRCEELENDDEARARKYIEDEMTRALVRECYKCKKSFIKTDGCNKMTCTCGARMCYICREPILDYKHFNGPGGEEKQKCPLYSTEKLLHVDAVEAVAKKALEEVTSKNPELKLKHDPTKILPDANTAKTTLPPGMNEEAQGLINLLQGRRQQIGEQNPQIPPRINENWENNVVQPLRAAVMVAGQPPRANHGRANPNQGRANNVGQQPMMAVNQPPRAYHGGENHHFVVMQDMLATLAGRRDMLATQQVRRRGARQDIGVVTQQVAARNARLQAAMADIRAAYRHIDRRRAQADVLIPGINQEVQINHPQNNQPNIVIEDHGLNNHYVGGPANYEGTQ